MAVDGAHKHFVTTKWLAEHLSAPDLFLIDATWHLPTLNLDAKAEYLAGHIPGAVHFDIDEICNKKSPLPHMLPDPIAFSSAMRAMGLGDGMRAVVYDSYGLFSAPRVWWMLRTFGVSDVHVLEGGLPAWKEAGLPLEDGPVRRQPRHFTPRLDHGAVASLEDVKKALASGVQIVDARSAARFRGEIDGPPRRIPGLPKAEPRQVIEEIAGHGAAPVQYAGDAVLFDQDVEVQQIVVDEMASVRQVGGECLQAAIRLVEGFAADRRCCQPGPPAAGAIPWAVIGDAQQHLLPTGTERVARAVQAAEAGGGRQVGQPHGVQSGEQGRQQHAHLCLVDPIDVSTGHSLRDRIVAAEGLAKIDYLRNGQYGRTEARGKSVAFEVVPVRAKTDHVAAPLPVEGECLRPLARADGRNSADTGAVALGQECFNLRGVESGWHCVW